ncbi:MAG: YceI family protein [Bacteroidetes bacterium]|nr:YceI family protein [Bacteroidota bacterium]
MATTKWTLDPTHSTLGFKIRHLMITNVSGSFKTFSVNVDTEEADFNNAEITAEADMASIFTNNEQRDAHLRNSDFFEIDAHPKLTFRSTAVEKNGSDAFALNGELTMKGVTKPVALQVAFNGITKDPWGNERAGFEIKGKINRSDWGINFNSALEAGGMVLGEEVKIESEIELIKQV